MGAYIHSQRAARGVGARRRRGDAPGAGPGLDAAAQVLAQLARHATPEQRAEMVIHIDPEMIGTPAEAGNS